MKRSLLALALLFAVVAAASPASAETPAGIIMGYAEVTGTCDSEGYALIDGVGVNTAQDLWHFNVTIFLTQFDGPCFPIPASAGVREWKPSEGGCVNLADLSNAMSVCLYGSLSPGDFKTMDLEVHTLNGILGDYDGTAHLAYF